MSSSSIIRDVAGTSFVQWCHHISGPAEHSCLMDYVFEWLESGDGIRACNGDWSTYLTALVGIVSKWHTRPGVTDYVDPDSGQLLQRRVSAIFDELDGHNHPALDRYQFEQMCFEYKYPYSESRQDAP
ncbi:hypothetical protein GCM10027059_45810 [Myceligenerans halotolerans]